MELKSEHNLKEKNLEYNYRLKIDERYFIKNDLARKYFEKV